jgi:hypothetical protein
MTRDCDTARMKRVDLVGLLDTMTSLDQQRITARMPAVQIEDVQDSAPQSVIAANDEITRPIDIRWSDPTGIAVRFRTPTGKTPALAVAVPVTTTPASGDMTLIGVICTLSLSLCTALAWLG